MRRSTFIIGIGIVIGRVKRHGLRFEVRLQQAEFGESDTQASRRREGWRKARQTRQARQRKQTERTTFIGRKSGDLQRSRWKENGC